MEPEKSGLKWTEQGEKWGPSKEDLRALSKRDKRARAGGTKSGLSKRNKRCLSKEVKRGLYGVKSSLIKIKEVC